MADANELVRGVARLALQQLLLVPGPAKIEAAMMVVKALFMEVVVPAKRLDLFDQYVVLARTEIENDLRKKGVFDAAKEDDKRRGDRRAGARDAKKKGSRPARARRGNRSE
jgi:hypothetical protein